MFFSEGPEKFKIILITKFVGDIFPYYKLNPKDSGNDAKSYRRENKSWKEKILRILNLQGHIGFLASNARSSDFKL